MRHRDTSVQLQLCDADRRDLLSAEEESALARVIRSEPQGSPAWLAARNELVSRNLRFVSGLAHRYPAGFHDDAFQDGISGLVGAAEDFDPDRDCRFTTFAYNRIRVAMLVGFRASISTIRVSKNATEKDCSESLKEFARIASQPILSIGPDVDVPAPEDDTVERDDCRSVIREFAGAVLDDLDGREREIFRLRFGIGCGDGEGRSFTQVGKVIGVSKQRVEQIQKAAEHRLVLRHRRYAEQLIKEAC